MPSDFFRTTLHSEAELREHYRMPSPVVTQKKIDRLDETSRRYVEHAPFVLIGTSAPDGTGDVSPKGGPPGFVVVLDDHHLAIPDLSGNNLLDSLSNVVNGSGVGLLFLIPGVEETLRVNGTACVTLDPDVLDACAVKDRRPKAALGVVVAEAFMHCAKAFRRSGLWRHEEWADRAEMPTLGCMIKEQFPDVGDVPAETIDELLEADYAATLWEPGGIQS
jgi:PPOX class probable FMN-dependent enzyme